MTLTAATSPASDLSPWITIGSREYASAKIGHTACVFVYFTAHNWDIRVSIDRAIEHTFRGTGGRDAAEAAFAGFWASHKATLGTMVADRARLLSAEDAQKRTRSVNGRNGAVIAVDAIAAGIRTNAAAIRAWKP